MELHDIMSHMTNALVGTRLVIDDLQKLQEHVKALESQLGEANQKNAHLVSELRQSIKINDELKKQLDSYQQQNKSFKIQEFDHEQSYNKEEGE